VKLPLTRRCWSWGGITADAIPKVLCERERGHPGDHYWWPEQRPTEDE
jgi:hypothetical protein